MSNLVSRVGGNNMNARSHLLWLRGLHTRLTSEYILRRPSRRLEDERVGLEGDLSQSLVRLRLDAH